MSKRRNMDGDLNKSPLKEKSPLREMHSGRSLRENLTIDEAFQVKNNFWKDENFSIALFSSPTLAGFEILNDAALII